MKILLFIFLSFFSCKSQDDGELVPESQNNITVEEKQPDVDTSEDEASQNTPDDSRAPSSTGQIDEKLNPKYEKFEFRTNSSTYQEIHLDLPYVGSHFNIKFDQVGVRSYIKIFSISQKEISSHDLDIKQNGTNLEIKSNYSMNDCEVDDKLLENITQVKGFCVFKVDLYLPKDLVAKVYLKNELLFFPSKGMSYDLLLEKFEQEGYSGDRFEAAIRYINSHIEYGSESFELSLEQLQTIFDAVLMNTNQYAIFELVYPYIEDTNELRELLKKELSYSMYHDALDLLGKN